MKLSFFFSISINFVNWVLDVVRLELVYYHLLFAEGVHDATTLRTARIGFLKYLQSSVMLKISFDAKLLVCDVQSRAARIC